MVLRKARSRVLRYRKSTTHWLPGANQNWVSDSCIDEDFETAGNLVDDAALHASFAPPSMHRKRAWGPDFLKDLNLLSTAPKKTNLKAYRFQGLPNLNGTTHKSEPSDVAAEH
eukprot:TRINITY_DN5549_c0_g1_i1.p2 TRINITY_DN5549_c0_g1~~TRINITY_DN5549_c0_g1_i1.p2  ORF type:complete len:113 (-),score=13.89 TRINITY_DN5549_c0_g1_i1:144-482(-)